MMAGRVSRALVTGGAGFIGSNIVKYLSDINWKVRVVDNLSSGYAVNLDGLNADFIQGDICDKELMLQLCAEVDVVFHLAASVGRQKSLDCPQQDSTTNLLGTINLLEAIKLKGVKRVVYSSSAAIFGELESPRIAEDHPQNADSPYGVSKLAAEKMILAYSNLYNINGVCLRYFNIYGLNQRFDLYGNVIPIFAERLYTTKPLTIYGDGNQTRDFLNVKDVVRANYLAATKEVKSGVYNLGSGKSITINQLAQMMKSKTGIDVNIEYAPKRPADVLHCQANTDKARKDLGFEALVELEDGLVEYLAWYKQNLR